ncbi:MAG: hypothetical protein ABR924_13980 [Terracidiphilus sp.]|jgi:hypothetical protein
MTTFGEILAILNQEQVVLRIEDEHTTQTGRGTILTVFAKAADPALSQLGIDALYSPKGEIRIVMQQTPNLFLAERYKEGGRVERRPISSLESIFMHEVRVGGQWSADIKEEDSLKIVFDRELKTGDLVGRV